MDGQAKGESGAAKRVWRAMLAVTALALASAGSAHGFGKPQQLVDPDTGDRLGGTFLAKAGGEMFFRAGSLRVTDGTQRGTRHVADVQVLSSNLSSSFHPDGAALNGAVYFWGSDPAQGSGLWRSDGTPKGTFLVAAQAPAWITSAGEYVYFVAEGGELWRSDGTNAGTIPLADFDPLGDSGPTFLTAVGNRLVFSASTPTTGTELWRSDGSPDGTEIVTEINPGPTHSIGALDVVSGGKVLFAADRTAGTELWASDGTASGTTRVAAIPDTLRSTFDAYTAAADGSLFFEGFDEAHGPELWRTAGDDRTGLVKDINPGPDGSSVSGIAALGDQVFFSAAVPEKRGHELWRSDGTRAGTRIVADLNPGPGSGTSAVSEPVAVGKTLFFVADNGLTGDELWRTRGTRNSTKLVAAINPRAPGSQPQQLTKLNRGLLFVADDGGGSGLWFVPPGKRR